MSLEKTDSALWHWLLAPILGGAAAAVVVDLAAFHLFGIDTGLSGQESIFTGAIASPVGNVICYLLQRGAGTA